MNHVAKHSLYPVDTSLLESMESIELFCSPRSTYLHLVIWM